MRMEQKITRVFKRSRNVRFSYLLLDRVQGCKYSFQAVYAPLLTPLPSFSYKLRCTLTSSACRGISNSPTTSNNNDYCWPYGVLLACTTFRVALLHVRADFCEFLMLISGSTGRKGSSFVCFFDRPSRWRQRDLSAASQWLDRVDFLMV
jgi:hypothetical protein